MQRTVIVSNFGSFISKKSERMVIKEGTEIIKEIPFFRIGEVIIGKKGVSLSTDFIAEASQRGIKVSFLDMSGKPYCMFHSASLNGNVSTKRMQLESYSNNKGLELVKKIISGKINNQSNLLKYFNKYQKTANIDKFNQINGIIEFLENNKQSILKISGQNINEKRSEVLTLEASAGKHYWKGISILLDLESFKREHRGTQNITNALFNYGYGILYSKIWGAIINAGLEPYAGFLHVDRINKPSMILDFVEEFRQPIIDKIVVAMLSKGVNFKMSSGLLTPDSKEKLAEKVLERLEDRVIFQGKEFALKSIIQIQARNVASFLRNEKDYKSYSFKW
ncbi:MAG: CRISPR-associated endonuclease Cas1 [Candidatus Sericytochromatia bacterium]